VYSLVLVIVIVYSLVLVLVSGQAACSSAAWVQLVSLALLLVIHNCRILEFVETYSRDRWDSETEGAEVFYRNVSSHAEALKGRLDTASRRDIGLRDYITGFGARGRGSVAATVGHLWLRNWERGWNIGDRWKIFLSRFSWVRSSECNDVYIEIQWTNIKTAKQIEIHIFIDEQFYEDGFFMLQLKIDRQIDR